MSFLVERESISPKDFKRCFLCPQQAVKVSGFLQEYNIASDWSFGYFRERIGSLKIPLKEFFKSGDIGVSEWTLSQYVDSIAEYEENSDLSRPPYCHDIPIFHLAPELVNDVASLPSDFFPSWYEDSWWDFVQFFMSPSGSVTPLHFDTLMTNNLFFQVEGVKDFFLLPFSERSNCYRRGWRWFDVDPTQERLDQYPDFNMDRCTKVTLNAGDMLYMPPGMLHHVVTREPSISFNVDFHTKASVLKSFLSIFERMPNLTAYYNFLSFLGVVLKVPRKYIFRFYRPYLNYIS